METFKTIDLEHSLNFGALDAIKLLRNPFVLKTDLNFRVCLRFDLEVLRAGRRQWSLFSLFCTTSLNSLSTSSWRRSESLIRLDSTKDSLYEQSHQVRQGVF